MQDIERNSNFPNFSNTENQEASECNCDIQGMYRKLHIKGSRREVRIQTTLG